MGPNDQYSYYYSSNTDSQPTQSNYNNYQPRANQNSQRTRQSSSSAPAQNYNYQQQSYSNDQAQQYNGQGYYGNTRDGGQTAAETLSRMGSAVSYPSSTATAYNQTQDANTYNSNYNQTQNTGYSSSATAQHQASNYPNQSSYATANGQQARPTSVSSVRSAAVATRSPVTDPVKHPRANASAQYSRTQIGNQAQRAASPAQIQASQQLQRLADQRNSEMAQSSTHSNQHTFVDPSAVYDPWPEYQRKLAAARAAKEAEERAATERDAEEKLEAEKEAKRHEEERSQKKVDEKERKKAEAARKWAGRKETGKAPKRVRKSKTAAGAESETSAGDSVVGGMNLQQLTTMANAAPAGSDAEAQIRQLMAMVKQMNDKHPDLLAKIWEEERQQHLEQASNDMPTAEQAPVGGASGTPNQKKKKKTPKKAAASAASATAENTAQTSATSRPQPKSKKVQAKDAPPPTPTAPVHPATPSTAPTRAPAQKANNSARGTIWPPEKKDQIAFAAVRWLSGLPGNEGRTITAPQVASMLDKNPTYIELCEMIEQLGFKVERSAFAKALLTSVPDVNANRSAASPAIPRPPSTGPLRSPGVAPPSKPVPLASGIQAVNRPPVQATATPSTQEPPPTVFVYESPYFDSQGQPIATTKAPKSKASKTKQDRKAQESKKTELMESASERPSETPGPVTKAEAARKRTFADLVDLTALSDDDMPPAKQMYYGPPPVTQPGQAYSNALDFLPNFQSVVDPHLQRSVDRLSQPTPPSLERQQMAAIAMKLNTMELGKPVDKNHALRRSHYDVRTLARDVLLATGKHPDLLPLNGHIEPLRSVFAGSINFNTDLSTLRWDLIDPGEPVPEALASIAHDDRDSVIDEADNESEEEVRHFAVRAPSHSQSIAQRVSVRAGDAPWAGRVIEMSSPTGDGFGRGKLVPSRSRGRPRGRPPRGFARFSTGGAQVPIGNHRGPDPAAASPAAGTSPARGTGYSGFVRETRPDGTKKRGRPVGWRKNIHGRGQAATGESSYTPTGQRANPATTTPASEPKFPIFSCRWKNCAAQLHNLETLRRHMKKKHGGPDVKGKFTCLWANCGRHVQTVDENGSVTQYTQHYDFPDTTELMTHVEKSHITPVAFELGDGPPGGFSDSNASDAEAYLSDRYGRRVTPTIPTAAPSSGPSSVQRSGRRGRPPKKSDEEKARESMAELAKKKREIGLGVDREGATFANEKRRAGFVDDEDGDEILVDESD